MRSQSSTSSAEVRRGNNVCQSSTFLSCDPAWHGGRADPLCSWHCLPSCKPSHGSKGTNSRDRVQLFTQWLYFKVGEG